MCVCVCVRVCVRSKGVVVGNKDRFVANEGCIFRNPPPVYIFPYFNIPVPSLTMFVCAAVVG